MSDLRKAAQAVIQAWDDPAGTTGVCRALDALRAALAKPEQEPVGWAYVNSDGECEQIEYDDTPPDDPSITLLYARPQDWGKR
jgi:hypothetical protein